MSKPPKQTLFDLYERMDRIEELIEDMDDLGVNSRDAAEKLIIELDSQIEALEAETEGEAPR